MNKAVAISIKICFNVLIRNETIVVFEANFIKVGQE